MNFTRILSRDYLQGLPEEHRLTTISTFVNQFDYEIVQVAKTGKTSWLLEENRLPSPVKGVRQWPPPYIPTTEEIVEAFKIKFSDCKVEYTEVWEETRPGVKTQKNGILVDWS